MLKIPYDDIIKKIQDQKGVSVEEIETKIKAKLDQLSGLISKEGAAHIIANELGIKLFDKTSGRMKIKDILAGMRDVEIVGKITAIYEVREFAKGDSLGKVGSFMLGDETGMIRIVCWNNKTEVFPELTQDHILKIVSAYTRENNGRLELHCNDNTKLVINPEGESIGEVKRQSTIKATRKLIKQLQETDQNIEILGTIVQVFDPRFYEICKECGKRARLSDGQFRCEKHGEVTPGYGYVMNAFIDDGSENIRVVFFRNQVCNLLKQKEEEVLAYKDSPQSFEDMKTDLLGEIVKITGRVSKNQMFDRLEFIAQMVFRDPDPKEELQRLENKEATQNQ